MLYLIWSKGQAFVNLSLQLFLLSFWPKPSFPMFWKKSSALCFRISPSSWDPRGNASLPPARLWEKRLVLVGSLCSKVMDRLRHWNLYLVTSSTCCSRPGAAYFIGGKEERRQKNYFAMPYFLTTNERCNIMIYSFIHSTGLHWAC